jgi:hypothetical protein
MNPIDVTGEEEKALQEAWNCLGVLLSFAVKELGREAGLKLCAGLASGQLTITWILVPSCAQCRISRGDDTVYTFEVSRSPQRFGFVELGSEPAN